MNDLTPEESIRIDGYALRLILARLMGGYGAQFTLDNEISFEDLKWVALRLATWVAEDRMFLELGDIPRNIPTAEIRPLLEQAKLKVTEETMELLEYVLDS